MRSFYRHLRVDYDKEDDGSRTDGKVQSRVVCPASVVDLGRGVGSGDTYVGVYVHFHR